MSDSMDAYHMLAWLGNRSKQQMKRNAWGSYLDPAKSAPTLQCRRSRLMHLLIFLHIEKGSLQLAWPSKKWWYVQSMLASVCLVSSSLLVFFKLEFDYSVSVSQFVSSGMVAWTCCSKRSILWLHGGIYGHHIISHDDPLSPSMVSFLFSFSLL